jgi:hypothetical protein
VKLDDIVGCLARTTYLSRDNVMRALTGITVGGNANQVYHAQKEIEYCLSWPAKDLSVYIEKRSPMYEMPKIGFGRQPEEILLTDLCPLIRERAVYLCSRLTLGMS